jgi:hypothetical protein
VQHSKKIARKNLADATAFHFTGIGRKWQKTNMLFCGAVRQRACVITFYVVFVLKITGLGAARSPAIVRILPSPG